MIESMSFGGLNLMIFMLFYFSLGVTSFYSMRLFYYSLLSKFSFLSLTNLGDKIYLMKYSIMLLSFFSLMFGSIFMWLVNLDLGFLILPFYLKTLTLLMVLLGLYFSYEMNSYNNYIFGVSYYFLNGSMWFMYSYSFMFFKLNFSYGLLLLESMYWGEFYGGLGISYYLLKLTNLLQFYSLNSYKIFLMTMIIWVIFML